MAYISSFVFSKCVAALAIMLTASVALAQSPLGAMYKLTEIPPLRSETANCSAQGINNKGQVVGSCTTATSAPGFIYSGSALTNLGTVGDLVGISVAGINDSGQVVGTASTSSQNPNYVFHAFLYSNGVMSDLGVPPGGSASSASAINNAGQIVGFAPFSAGGVPYAFLYNAGVWTNLGVFQGAQSPPASSAGYAVNNSGQVVGACDECTTPGNSNEYAFLFRNGSMIDLGALSADAQSSALGINDKGEITGYSDNITVDHAFLYSGGRMKDLGVPAGGTSSVAHAINNMGTVVGTSYQGTPGDFHAFVYAMGGITDLNKLISANYGVTLTSANAINNAGQIAATGYAGAAGSPSRAYLLTPCASFDAQLSTFPAGDAISNNDMHAMFTQQSGLTLSALAHACGFKGFNFQQFVTSRPCPSPTAAEQYPADPNLLPKANFCTSGPGGLTAPPEFPDPPPGGYKVHPPNYDPYPYYYSYADAVHYETLQFDDVPSDVCLYDYNLDPATWFAQPKQCGENVPRAGHESQSFQTALVGMIDEKTPSPPLCVFTWTSNWSGFRSNTGFVTPGPLEGSCTTAGTAPESVP